MVANGSSQRADSRIFISYRREETAYAAGWLFDRLRGHFGPGQVFKDVDCIEPGQDFVAEIRNAVGSCDALLALIGNRWITIRTDNDQLRLEDPGDYVRLEIESALQRNIRVIPVLIDGASMPSPEELPAGMGDLVFRQAFELSHSRFDSDSDRLVQLLDRILSEGRVEPSGAGRPRPRRRRLLPIAGLLALAMALGVAIVARWADQGAGSSGQTDVQQKKSVQVTQGAQVPESDPLPDDALVVPRGPSGALQLYRVSSKGALAPVQLTALAVAHGPTLSPNRKTIIYLRGTGTSKVRVMAADGTGDRKLFRKPPSGCEDVRHLAWSPTVVDLLALVCVDPNGYSRIVLVHLDGTVQHSLHTRSNFADDPSFSPDGSKIAYWASSTATATSGSLFTIAADGGGRPQRLTDGLFDADPVWSPHGDQLAFTRSRAGGPGSSAICLISAVPGGSPIALVDLPGENSRPTWSPAGDKIAYVHAPAGSATKDVWLKRVGSSVPPHALGISAASMGTPIWGHR